MEFLQYIGVLVAVDGKRRGDKFSQDFSTGEIGRNGHMWAERNELFGWKWMIT